MQGLNTRLFVSNCKSMNTYKCIYTIIEPHATAAFMLSKVTAILHPLKTSHVQHNCYGVIFIKLEYTFVNVTDLKFHWANLC